MKILDSCTVNEGDHSTIFSKFCSNLFRDTVVTSFCDRRVDIANILFELGDDVFIAFGKESTAPSGIFRTAIEPL